MADLVFETAAFSSVTDLLDKLQTFLVTSNSWTLNHAAAVSTGKRLHVNRVGGGGETIYANFRALSNETRYGTNDGTTTADSPSGATYTDHILAMCLSTGQDAGASGWEKQSGHPTNYNSKFVSVEMCGSADGTRASTAFSSPPLPSNPVYYFIHHKSPVDVVFIWIDMGAGLWQWLAFGECEKTGSWTGGTWFAGSMISGHADPSSTIRNPLGKYVSSASAHNFFMHVSSVDTYTGWIGSELASNYARIHATQPKAIYMPFAEDGGNPAAKYYNWPAYGGFTSGTAGNDILDSSLNSINGKNLLLPFNLWIGREDSPYTTTNYWSSLGKIPKIYLTRQGGIAAGAKIGIGGTAYRVFPNRTSSATGIAYAIESGEAYP